MDGAEPSGLDLAPLTPVTPGAKLEPDGQASAGGCDVRLDRRSRALERSASVLEAWNLTAAQAPVANRLRFGAVFTEADARTRTCGEPGCVLDQPTLVLVEDAQHAGYALLIPVGDGEGEGAGELLIAPLPGGNGLCEVQPELFVEQLDQGLHVRARIHRGDYIRYYFHGELDQYGGAGYVPSYGECEVESTVQTDLLIDVTRGTLELSFTQALDPTRVVELGFEGDTAVLLGCKGAPVLPPG